MSSGVRQAVGRCPSRTMMPKEKVSTADVSLLPTWKSSGARWVTVPEPDLQRTANAGER